MKQLLPYQSRVVTEFTELETKCNALYMFLATKTFEELNKYEQDLLKMQYYAMQVYLGILEKRIEKF